jgi:hypothetical protein
MSRRTALLMATPFAALLACGEPLATPDVDAPQYAAGGTSEVRTTWPSPGDAGPPFYARINPQPPHVYDDGEWAAVVFYRDPACIRADFNLVGFFDPPAAMACTPVVTGASIWGNGIGVGSPKVATMSGNAVPIWFFPAAALLAELQDGEITIGELAAVPGRLVGVASRYNETLHPAPLPPFMGGGGHPNPGIVITAHGTLEDGRRFQYHLRLDDSGLKAIQIMFR